MKTHKEDMPLRRVISAVGTAMYPLSKYLSKVLGTLVNTTDYTVRNSEKFVNIVQGIRIEKRMRSS